VAYQSFEDLEVWKKALAFSVKVYEVLKRTRDFGLKDQMTRAAVSIASNIAEGAERDSKAEFVRFLHIAKGSVAELRTQMYVASRIGVISDEKANELADELKVLSKQLHALIKHLKPKT
jgi:four helix bundle protein